MCSDLVPRRAGCGPFTSNYWKLDVLKCGRQTSLSLVASLVSTPNGDLSRNAYLSFWFSDLMAYVAKLKHDTMLEGT